MPLFCIFKHFTYILIIFSPKRQKKVFIVLMKRRITKGRRQNQIRQLTYRHLSDVLSSVLSDVGTFGAVSCRINGVGCRGRSSLSRSYR